SDHTEFFVVNDRGELEGTIHLREFTRTLAEREALGQLVVSDDVDIAGAGQESTIVDGNASDRVFEIQPGIVAEISAVTIQNGYVAWWRDGGGIYNGGNLTLTNSTVSGNTAYWGGGIHASWMGYATLTNTIVADNGAPTGANCLASVLSSLGYNLTDDTSCGVTAPGDLIVADAMLGPLQDNGGPTQTHDLLPGSPAIDAGSPGCPPPDTDQRGVARPQGAACDIGAFELELEIIPVEIDIRPGSDGNPINPANRGVIPVAILGSDTFDVESVDGQTLAFARAGAAPRHDLSDPETFEDHLQDVNDDGLMDLVSHYRTLDTGITSGDSEACPSSETLDGLPCEGCDAIRTSIGGRHRLAR
ncbi:MAG: hypothetical protein JSW43_04655, partial [Gemmatimonadota bacterium]